MPEEIRTRNTERNENLRFSVLVFRIWLIVQNRMYTLMKYYTIIKNSLDTKFYSRKHEAVAAAAAAASASSNSDA